MIYPKKSLFSFDFVAIALIIVILFLTLFFTCGNTVYQLAYPQTAVGIVEELVNFTPKPDNNAKKINYSYAIAITTKDNNNTLTLSAEDRQWRLVKKGDTVKVKYFKYPPWYMLKSETLYGARIVQLYRENWLDKFKRENPEKFFLKN